MALVDIELSTVCELVGSWIRSAMNGGYYDVSRMGFKPEKRDVEYGLNDIKCDNLCRVVATLTCRSADTNYDLHARQRYYKDAKNVMYNYVKTRKDVVRFFERVLKQIADDICSYLTTVVIKCYRGQDIIANDIFERSNKVNDTETFVNDALNMSNIPVWTTAGGNNEITNEEEEND